MNLKSGETSSLFEDYKDDFFVRGGNLLGGWGGFDWQRNNCAQVAYSHVVSSIEWDSSISGFVETMTVTDRSVFLWGLEPVLFTNDAIALLEALGAIEGRQILGKPRRGLTSPANAPSNVIVYWSYKK